MADETTVGAEPAKKTIIKNMPNSYVYAAGGLLALILLGLALTPKEQYPRPRPSW